MADINGGRVAGNSLAADQGPGLREGGAPQNNYEPPPPPGPVTYYKMRWVDVDCMTPTVRTWIASGAPDPTGLQYAGPKCGATPITGATAQFSWTA